MARILGWNVIVKKNEFNVGDKVVYFEIDSLLPEDNPMFDFLKSSKGKMKPIQTKKIRGVVSQGLAMPCKDLNCENFDIGEDVTEFLKVKKHEIPEIPFYKNMRAATLDKFPYFIPKTDETRVQVLQEKLNLSAGKVFVATEKLDGTSITCFVRNGQFGVCSRNLLLNPNVPSPYADYVKRIGLEKKMQKLYEVLKYDFAIQGELIGTGIQGNKYQLSDTEMKLFNFYNITEQTDIGFFDKTFRYDMKDVADALELETVPIIADDFIMTNDIDALVKYSQGQSVLNPSIYREGIVFRAKYPSDFYALNFGLRMSFKAINPDFLCKYSK